jgi:hypothetical protein
VGNYYSFRLKVQDPDIRIGKDKLKFSIQNQNTNDSLKLDLVCETVSKFKEDFRLGDGSIYYRINNVNDIYVDYCVEPDPKYINCVSMMGFFLIKNTLYVKGISYDNNYLQ